MSSATQGELGVLRLLRSSEAPVSGESIARLLCVTRSSIWKYVRGLRAAGYVIDGAPSGGYVLGGLPQSVTPHEIVLAAEELESARLSSCLSAHPLQVTVHERLSSTNDLAKKMAAEGAPAGTVVAALSQSGGRGRLGREWSSPQGGCWFSIILRPGLPMDSASILTLAAAVAVAASVRGVLQDASTAGGSVDPGSVTLKWPNDILLGEAKLGGILCEATGQADRVDWLVVGVGLNIGRMSVTDVGDMDQAVGAVTLPADSSGVLVARLIAEISVRLLKDGRHPDPGAIVAEWKRLSSTIGRRVSVAAPWPGSGRIEGSALDLTEDGSLLVQTGGGSRVSVSVGDLLYHP